MKPKIVIFVAGACIASGLAFSQLPVAEQPPQKVAVRAPVAPTKLAEYVAPKCGAAKRGPKGQESQRRDVRKSAQHGLNFLMKATSEWQDRNKCFGCHVQGVAGEALSVGLKNDYNVRSAHTKLILNGILDLNGGLRNEEGHAHVSGELRPSSRAYGGAAIARYDQWISDEYADDLMNAAQDLLAAQASSGAIAPAHVNPPVSQGEVQATYLAIQTWRQAYERSGDERWLTAVSNGERYLRTVANRWKTGAKQELQQMNYTMLGLVNAGVSSTDPVIVDLQATILSLQQKDGSWLETTQKKHALTTGQTIYALRHTGMTESDPAVSRGIEYLLKSQQNDGGWSDGGSEKAAAMWAVLGLVATDVMSIAIDGLQFGQHVSGETNIQARVTDNQGSSVAKVELAIDDILVAGSCGDKLDYTLAAAGLSKGPHTVDFIATNAKGEQTKRRIGVYAGHHYLTDLGTRYQGTQTAISVRDIAPAHASRTLTFNVFESTDDLKGKKVFSKDVKGNQGPVSVMWSGEESKEQTEFIAEVTYKDQSGTPLHTVSLPFIHDSMEAQKAQYAEVAGNVGFARGGGLAENATVELLDNDGNVVQSVQSTRSGAYKFRNLKDGKKYKVRVKKRGFKPAEREFKADKAEDREADFAL